MENSFILINENNKFNDECNGYTTDIHMYDIINAHL